MERKWFYYQDGKGFGPYEAKTISSWVESGKLDDSTIVWCEDINRPKPLCEVEAFEDRQAPSTEPPPLPDKSPSSPEGSAHSSEAPPPLPYNRGDGPPDKAQNDEECTQAREDQDAANWMRRASMVTLAVLFLAGAASVVLQGGEATSENTNGYRKGASSERQTWPSVFNVSERNYLQDPLPPSAGDNLAEDMVETVGFWYGQRASLNRIRQLYSETHLAREAIKAQIVFRSIFGNSLAHMDSLMSETSDGQWKDIRQNVEEQVESSATSSRISRERASAFVDTVRNRSKGELPSPVLETLLMFKPEYIRRPEKVFADGFTKEFRTGGHVKSQGIDLGIEFPASWKAEEGRRPHIVQRLTSENGRGRVHAMINVQDLGERLTGETTEPDLERDLASLDSKEFFRSIIQNAFTDSEVFETGYARLAGEKTVWGQFNGVLNRAGIEMDIHGLAFMVVRDGKFVQVMYIVGEARGDSARTARDTFEHYGALFQQMTNSIDFFGRYQ